MTHRRIHQLRWHRRHHRAIRVLQHPTLHLVADNLRLHNHLRVILTSLTQRRIHVLPPGHPANPNRRSPPSRLHIHRQPQQLTISLGERLLPPQNDFLPHRQALRRQQLLRVLLIHAARRRQHPRAHVRNPRQFKQPLNRPVFPIQPMQHRENHIHCHMLRTVRKPELPPAHRVGGE